MNAVLALEDGTWYQGVSAGAPGETSGEVVFNTAMTGYQEVLTDPSYAGQIVTMTAPQIGNYGVGPQDAESIRPTVAGFIMREASPVASNWRATGTLRDYLVAHNIVAIADIDTRALTRNLRSAGVMRGVIATGAADVDELIARARSIPKMEGLDLVREVTCQEAFDWPHAQGMPDAEATDTAGLRLEPQRRARRRLRVGAYDFGIKWNILRRLTTYGCDVRVFPASAPAGELVAAELDGIFLSNGPGDPAVLDYAIENTRELLQGDVPIFGICLGHQIMGLAMGGRTFKLKFGHRGANHPVKHLGSGQVEITCQNHGFAVDPESLPSEVQVTHLNLYDGTIEGLRHVSRPFFSVQYHPEASPGPHDADYLFRQFVDEMERRT
jgi:carbamoyl-phosphate synthase small subunit